MAKQSVVVADICEEDGMALEHYLFGEADEDLVTENSIVGHAERVISALPDELAPIAVALRKARAHRLAFEHC